MPHLDYRAGVRRDAFQGMRSVIADRHKPTRAQQLYQQHQELAASFSLTRSVWSVRERIVGFMRMQRKDVPEEDSIVDSIEHVPDDGCRPLRDGSAFGRPIQRNAPPRHVTLNMHIISKGEARAPTAAIP